MEHIYDVIIIGGGPGGYTAALYAARAGLDVLVLEKLSAGGQMALTSQIDNYPGFENGVDGFELAEKMQAGAERFGAKTELAEVYSAELKDKIKKINTSEGVFLAKTVVISTGASPRELGLEKEQALVGRGVNYCAACDGMFFRGKKVAVVGGGNSAAADALLLSRICEKVTVIHRRDALRATKIYHEPLMQAENVEFAWDSVVTDLIFEDGFQGVKLKNVQR
jgi:thioredoxin reductase (NADPH)